MSLRAWARGTRPGWLARLGRLARRQPHADIATAVVVFVVTLLTTATMPAPTRVDAAAVAVASVACGALVLRRRHPFTAFVVSAVAAEAYLAMYGGHEGAMVLAAPLIALSTAAEQGSRRRALLIGVLAVLALAAVHMLVKPASWLGAENLALAAFGGLAVAAGDATRSRRQLLAEVEARARRAEAERDAEAARQVTEERLRIARDLHDVLGHQLALINVQAGVASYVLAGHGPAGHGPAPAAGTGPPADLSDPAAREALAHIRAASKAALDELRDTIGLLRQPDEAATPTEPTTGLTGLPQLLASFGRAGLIIDHRERGRPRAVPAPVDLTAYRIVQESLTNVCKHAGPCAVTVTVDYLDDAVRVAVLNPPTGRPATATHGNGLLGMRERVAALAGVLHAGPRPDGGFAVTASLPASTALPGERSPGEPASGAPPSGAPSPGAPSPDEPPSVVPHAASGAAP